MAVFVAPFGVGEGGAALAGAGFQDAAPPYWRGVGTGEVLGLVRHRGPPFVHVVRGGSRCYRRSISSSTVLLMPIVGRSGLLKPSSSWSASPRAVE